MAQLKKFVPFSSSNYLCDEITIRNRPNVCFAGCGLCGRPPLHFTYLRSFSVADGHKGRALQMVVKPIVKADMGENTIVCPIADNQKNRNIIAMEKEMFCFKKSWRDMLEGLPDRVKMEVGWAIIEYGLYGKLVDLKPMANGVFGVLKRLMDCDEKEAVDGHEDRTLQALARMRIDNQDNIDDDNKNINNQKIEKESRKKETEKKKKASPQPSPVGEGESYPMENIFHQVEKEDPSEKGENSLNVKAFVEYFNETLRKAGSVIPHMTTCSGRRAQSLKARCRENGKAAVKTMVDKASVSNFLNGKNNIGWTATIDWLLRPNNFVKVIEGNYDNGITSVMNGKTSKNNDYGNNWNNEIDPRRGTEAGEYAAD